ncbi:MAG: DUF971 domain-containing protein [Planctomycetes bacterium]|jgi:DUF971 family protein|nr:DUF971 domain-containing protein [Planctomycetota bacterium]MBT4029480.1 DUF971 domain-containing protein [Planctomycetota bacterium]MBT4560650.1 DUF971 domain-containing protein [Planctomycetota bacterium]MBT5101451.1 DUF971 domain-containing protein [Planctomycetota bacterium]MBT5119879.1 DUF971 domain-containing protein [Planctomycetota bacterium]
MDISLTGIQRSDGGIRFVWSDGIDGVLMPRTFRLACPCAHCISEVTGKALLEPGSVPQDIEIKDMQPVGNYAYKVLFSDGHDSGLYPLELLASLTHTST